MTFILAMLAFALASGLLGGVLGAAYGIEAERKFKRPKKPELVVIPAEGTYE